MTPTAERRVELTLPMIADIEIAAARAASDLAREIAMPAERIDEMAHAIIEACINAREHAGCEDRRIYLRFIAGSNSEGRNRLDVWITDHGRGFDPQTAAQKSAHQPQKRGWGLKIMKAYMDEVEIDSSSEGTTVHMVKYSE